MNVLDAIILGIVEGITEFFPISSTGHLILAARLLGVPDSDFLTTFNIAIQVGAILAVVVLYGKTLVLNAAIIKRVTAAFIPTATIGFLFYKPIRTLLSNEMVAIWSIGIGGAVLILFEIFHKEEKARHEDLSMIPYKLAVIIGFFQALALIPGVSRSAATIIGGLALGMKRKSIVEFSFLLAVPTMLAATGWDLVKNPTVITAENVLPFAAGFITSFIVAILAIKWLIHFVQNHSFMVFGFYRIFAAFVFWWVLVK